MVFTFWQKDEAYKFRIICAEMSDQVGGAWDKTDFKDEEDCKAQMARGAMIKEFIGLFLSILVQVHFVLVLFTHYKNAHLTKSKGGCMPDLEPNVQLGHVQPGAAGVVNNSIDSVSDNNDNRVEHAVDDAALRHQQNMSQFSV